MSTSHVGIIELNRNATNIWKLFLAISLTQLLAQIFEFIAHPQIWKAVEAAAAFILTSKKQTISCEEVFTVVNAVCS